MGKSELTAAIALLLTCGDGEERAEVYGCVHILAEAVASPLLHLYQERAGTYGWQGACHRSSAVPGAP